MQQVIERRSPVCMYFQLKQALCSHIHTVGPQPGDRLPSVRELVDSYGVSLPVVRQAIGELASEGVLRVEQGRGTFLQRIPPTATPDVVGSTVLFITCSHEVSDPYFSRLLRGVQDEATEHDLNVIYAHPTANRPLEELLRQGSHIGVILSGIAAAADVRTVVESDTTCVLAGEVASGAFRGGGLHHVANDDFTGGYLAGDHLIALGHRRIACLTGTSALPFWRRRLDGLRQAMIDHGLDLPDAYVIQSEDETTAAGAAAMRALLDLPTPPTAVFAGSDRLAYGVYACCQETGTRIPGDCSVIGFDDLPLSEALTPALTSIHPQIERLGRRAVQILLDQCTRDPAARACERIVLPVTLVTRGSTCPIST